MMTNTAIDPCENEEENELLQLVHGVFIGRRVTNVANVLFSKQMCNQFICFTDGETHLRNCTQHELTAYSAILSMQSELLPMSLFYPRGKIFSGNLKFKSLLVKLSPWCNKKTPSGALIYQPSRKLNWDCRYLFLQL